MAHAISYFFGGLLAVLAMGLVPSEARKTAPWDIIPIHWDAAPPPTSAPTMVVNRAGKGDRAPLQSEQARDRREPKAPTPRKLLDGCEPSFSPVAAPSMAHHSGRCVA